MSTQVQQLINAIRAAAEDDASPTEKERGAEACKTLGALFGATPGEPLAPRVSAPTPLGQAVEQVRGAKTAFLLDAVIARLKSHLPEGEPAAESAEMKLAIPFIPIPGLGKK